MATGVGIEMVIDNELATFDTYTPTETLAYANQTMDIPVKLNYLQVADEVTLARRTPSPPLLWPISDENEETSLCAGRAGQHAHLSGPG